MLDLVIIGSGNVAQHLILAFSKAKNINLVQVFARDKNSLTHLLDANKIISNFKDIKEAAIYIIAVSDTAVAEVSCEIPFSNKIVLHTSGSVAIEDLDSRNCRGSFYPVQTFTKSKKIDFTTIPICIEIEQSKFYEIINTLALSVSEVVYVINSEQRKSLHLSAVFVNNFVNHLYKIGNDICIENKISFEILKPLIIETAQKVELLNPNDAQTGPARRNDIATINKHLTLLTDQNQKDIYKILTKSIIDNGKKL